MIRLGILLGVVLAATVTGVAAHHASSGLYDNQTIGEIEGEVSSIFWRNPHVRISITRAGENGQEEEWDIEFGSVNTLERIGVSRDLVQVGDRISVSGSLGRNGRQAMFAELITFSDGEQLALQARGLERRYGITESTIRSARNVDAELRADIFRVWIPNERPQTGSGTNRIPVDGCGPSRAGRVGPRGGSGTAVHTTRDTHGHG